MKQNKQQNELADSQCEIGTKDIKEAVDNAGMSGQVKIF